MPKAKPHQLGLGRARMGGPGLPARRRNNGHRFGPLTLLRWVDPPHWPTNPRWWHHADRVIGYLLALSVVGWWIFESFFEQFVLICQ
jgi:hypothetical protein